MAFYGADKMVVPHAAGGAWVLLNTPVYFWLVMILWWIARTHLGVLFLYTLISTLVSVLAFLVMRQLIPQQPKLAVILATIVAFSEPLIMAAKDIWQPHFVPLFTLLTLLLYFFGLRKRSSLFIFLALLCAFITFLEHYSGIFILLPISVLAIGVFVTQRKWRQLMMTLFCLIGFFWMWVALSKSKLDQVTMVPAFDLSTSSLAGRVIQPTFITNVSLTAKFFFDLKSDSLAFFITIGLVVGLVLVVIFDGKRDLSKQSLLFLTVSMLAFGFYPESLAQTQHYLFVSYIVMAVTTTVLIGFLWRKNVPLGLCVLLLVLEGVNRNYIVG